MPSNPLTADQLREARAGARQLRRRLGDLHDGFRHESIRNALDSLYARSLDSQRINFDSLTGHEADLLLLCLEQTFLRELIADLDRLELSRQNAARN